ncbi:MAG TPA: hypothetical protein DHV68_08880 [Dehalococcoidia bacterium]|nr:hypothetical protein [Dehalococcoidia bacterium]|tara:strand:+ start:1859 stop:3139 length:1281 start_codon:yes stop_codon:yes gene_type:complete
MVESTPKQPPSESNTSGLNPFWVLRFGNYRFVWSSEALSLWAIEMEIIVLAMFVLRDTNSPLLVGLIGALKFAGTLLGPLYGLMVDRFDRKRLQVSVRIFGVVLASILTTLIINDTLQFWHAYLIVTAGSMVRMLDLVLVQALTADAVPANSLHGAIGLSRSTLDGARVVGALAGGTIFELLGLDVAYISITVLYLFATVAALKVETRTTASKVRNASIKSGLLEGLSYVRKSKFLPGLIFFSFLIEFSAFPVVNGLMTVVCDELYELGGTGIGRLAAVASLGALSGATYIGIRKNLANPTRIMIIGSTIWHFIMLLLALTPPLWLFALMLFIWGFSGGTTFVAMVVGLLRATTTETRGRVMGIRSLGIYGLPLGLLLGGWIAEESGSAAMIATLGGLGFIATLAATLKWPALLGAQLRPTETEEV